MHKNIKYFPGLNGLRFFAAFAVLMHHAETIRNKHGLFNLEEYSLFQNGSTAVSFFFVLSGFLISYLLLKEDKEKGDISIRGFYWRRILRIWPLYFLLVIIGLWLVPFALRLIGYDYQMPYHPMQVSWMYLFFMPFLVNILYGSSLLEPLWSIGVEELFYLIWAPLMKFLRHHMLKIFLMVILLKIAVSLAFYFTAPHSPTMAIVGQVTEVLKFEAMAIGGIGAYFVYHGTKPFSNWKIFSKGFQILGIFLLTARIALHQELIASNSIVGEAYSAIFTLPIFSNLSKTYSDVEIGVHLHSHPSTWEEKIEAAYQSGCKRFDGALKGFGGCPMAKDELVGNIATENLIAYFQNKNIDLDLNMEAWKEAMLFSSNVWRDK